MGVRHWLCNRRARKFYIAYAVARISRIYSVAMPAIITTFVLDHIGMSLDPQLYFHSSSNFDLWHYVSGLLFINQTWWNTLSVGSDLPYWSLGFEVPFYIMFGIIFFSGGPSAKRYGQSARSC